MVASHKNRQNIAFWVKEWLFFIDIKTNQGSSLLYSLDNFKQNFQHRQIRQLNSLRVNKQRNRVSNLLSENLRGDIPQKLTFIDFQAKGEEHRAWHIFPRVNMKNCSIWMFVLEKYITCLFSDSGKWNFDIGDPLFVFSDREQCETPFPSSLCLLRKSP